MNTLGTRRSRAIADMNVTPLVDVMLVLLIVFMVSAPLLTSSLQLDLPQVAAAPTEVPVDAPVPVTVDVDREGRVWIGKRELDRPFATVLAEVPELAAGQPLHLRADQLTPYGVVAEVVGEAQRAGVTKVELVVDPIPGVR